MIGTFVGKSNRWAPSLCVPVVLLAAHVLSSPALAQVGEVPTVGNTTIVVKTVTSLLDAERRELDLRDDIYHNELIETGNNSATELTFLDQTKLSLGPESSVVLDRFVFDPDPDNSSFVMSVVRGVLRFVSGRLPKESYAIHTPVATIGIRGTAFEIRGAETGATSVIVHDGTVLAAACGRRFVLETPGEVATFHGAAGDECMTRHMADPPLDRTAELR